MPKPSGQSSEDYVAYKLRACFFNATGRTLEGLHGLMFRKNTQIEYPETVLEHMKNVDGKGNSAQSFINKAAKDCMITGFGGVLIDAPDTSDLTSYKEVEEQGVYPYIVFYKAEEIINWGTKVIGRKEVLSFVVLEECYDDNTEDIFTSIERKRYRVLQLKQDEEGKNVYTQTVYLDDGAISGETITPQKNGEVLNYIPFYFLPDEEPQKPLLIDLAEVNLSMYRKSADLENGGHWTGVPTPYATGFRPETKTIMVSKTIGGEIKQVPMEVPVNPLCLGGSEFLCFPEAGTMVGYLEFTGTGLDTLITMMDNDRSDMAILGARIISAEKNGVEAAETAKIHRAGENSVLASFANYLSEKLTVIFKEYLDWCTGQDVQDVVIKINTDYDVGGLSASELSALVATWQQGGISRSVLFHNIKQGEYVPEGTDYNDMIEEIEREGHGINDEKE